MAQPEPEPEPEPEDCTAKGDCVARATAAKGAGDLELALELLEGGCAAEDANACHEAAIVAHDDLHQSERAIPSLDAACTLDNADSCVVLGIFYAQGVGVSEDEARAAELFEKACGLGRQDACEAIAPAPEPTSKVAGANIKVGSLEADGLMAIDLQCRATSGGGGLFGTLGIVAGLAKSKKALDKCAPAGDAPTVFWTASSKGLSNVRVEDTNKKTAACVRKALKNSAMPLEGECAATILIGKRSGAEKVLKNRQPAG